MKAEILFNSNCCYTYEPIDEFFGLYDLDINVDKPTLIAIGPNHTAVSTQASKYVDYNKMFLIPEEPNAFLGREAHSHITSVEKTFDKIFTICKYTKKWREEYYDIDINKRVYITHPWSSKYSFPDQEKTIPVYYTGHKHPSDILNYIYKTIDNSGGKIVDAARGSITHTEKMKLNGQAKISITHGLLFLEEKHKSAIQYLSNWDKCEAFTHLNLNIVPQMKTRIHEAALSKSIILHKRDPWNVIQDWYTPLEDFIYFDNERDLLEKINEINNNYESYKYIAENAYNKITNNYMIKHFVDKYIEKGI